MIFDLSASAGEQPERVKRATEPVDTGTGSTLADPSLDLSAPGSGASTPPPDYPADPGIRRFVRRGVELGSAGQLWYALGRFVGVAAPTSQGGLQSAAVQVAQASPNERQTPPLAKRAPAEQRPWYDDFVSG